MPDASILDALEALTTRLGEEAAEDSKQRRENEAAAAAKGARSTYESHAWALAMTAVYGPVGTHPLQTEHPDVIAAKTRAGERLRTFLAA